MGWDVGEWNLAFAANNKDLILNPNIKDPFWNGKRKPFEIECDALVTLLGLTLGLFSNRESIM